MQSSSLLESLRGVFSRYKNYIPADEFDGLVNTTLYKAEKVFDENKNSNPLPLAVLVMKNLCIDYIKKNKKHISLSDNYDVAEPIPSNSENSIKDCIESLGKSDREVIRQRYYEKMTYEEISNANGYSVDTAVTRVRNAELKIKKLYLEDYV